MLTPEDLQSIASLIKVETDTIRKDMSTKSDIRELKKYLESKIELSTRVNAKMFKIELAEIKRDITTVLKQHHERIEILEEATLPKSTKN